MCTAEKKARSRNQPTGQWIRREKRLAINLRDGMICLVCMKRLFDADPQDVTLDHIEPKSDGGSNHESNLYTCCKHCNSSRGDKPLSRFAGRESVAHIRRNVRRSLRPYLRLAKAYFADEVGREELIERNVL